MRLTDAALADLRKTAEGRTGPPQPRDPLVCLLFAHLDAVEAAREATRGQGHGLSLCRAPLLSRILSSMTYRGRAVPAGGWIDCDSECFAAVRIDRSTASATTMTVEFRKGNRYQARGVPHSVVADFFLAGSMGRFWHDHLKDAYHWRKV